MLDKIINFPLAANPVNWIMISLMLLVSGLLLHVLLQTQTGSN